MNNESMLELEEKMLDINILQAIDSYERALSLYEFSSMESADNVITEFTFNDVKKKIIELGKKAIETIKKFIHSASIKIDTKIQQMKINIKLKELKNLLATKKSKAMKSKFTFVDVRKYKKYYKKYINTYVAEMKSGLNRDFKSVEEFEKWRDKMTSDLSGFVYTLSDKERWTLTNAVNDAVKLSEDEIKNKSQSIKQLKDQSVSIIDELTKIATRCPDAEYAKDTAKTIFTGKRSMLGFVISKITQAIKTVVSFVTKHTFACITGLIVLLIAL